MPKNGLRIAAFLHIRFGVNKLFHFDSFFSSQANYVTAQRVDIKSSLIKNKSKGR